MIRRPPRSTPLSLHDALPISTATSMGRAPASRTGLPSDRGIGQFAGMVLGELPRHAARARTRSEEHTSELQSQSNLVCRLLLEKKKKRLDYHSSFSTSLMRSD